jgi:flagellar basal body-associated protein FliL
MLATYLNSGSPKINTQNIIIIIIIVVVVIAAVATAAATTTTINVHSLFHDPLSTVASNKMKG